MLLKQLLKNLDYTLVQGCLNTEVTDIYYDSRKVTPGGLFVCIVGTQRDSHDYAADVAAKGAAVLAIQHDLPAEVLAALPDVTVVKFESTRYAMALLSTAYFGRPALEMTMVGVTGTNGKTTTATLIYEMARMMGYKAGLLSTVCNYIDSEAVPTNQTTPDPLTLNELLHRMVVAGCTYAAMEVSSHAAHQHRIAGLKFAGGVFTNLTRDHLDYHKTVEAYLSAKKSFFDNLSSDAFALTNIDDKVGLVMLQNCDAKRRTYSLRANADFMGRVIESRLDGTLMSFNGHEVETLFTGRYNAYNLTAVYGTATMLGWDAEKILVDMSRLVPVAGRFQTIHSPAGVTAVVDYAHTPDAVVNVLQAIREVTGHDHNIITVVGAGGNRDKGKRPIMAREAAMRSDRVVLTSDNPRDEEPEEILREMEAGLDTPELRANVLSITDRKEAIRTAVMLAKAGDVVLIAGKGHENYQEVKGVKHHFDDCEVVKEIFDTQK